MGTRVYALVRSLIVGAAFVSIWTWFVPRWIAQSKNIALTFGPGPVAMVFMSAGAIVAIWCMWEFAWTGLGTPAPFDAPRRLVVRGPYRWVRNPMYIGVGVFLIGEALALRGLTREMLALVATLWIVVTVFILIYEEPTLRRLFGDEYERYCRSVRRWLPRLTPFDKRGDGDLLSPHLD